MSLVFCVNINGISFSKFVLFIILLAKSVWKNRSIASTSIVFTASDSIKLFSSISCIFIVISCFDYLSFYCLNLFGIIVQLHLHLLSLQLLAILNFSLPSHLYFL